MREKKKKKLTFFTASLTAVFAANSRRRFTTVTHKNRSYTQYPWKYHIVAQSWRTAEAWSPSGAQGLTLSDVKVQNHGSDRTAGYHNVDKNIIPSTCVKPVALPGWCIDTCVSESTNTHIHTGEDGDPRGIPVTAPSRRAPFFYYYFFKYERHFEVTRFLPSWLDNFNAHLSLKTDTMQVVIQKKNMNITFTEVLTLLTRNSSEKIYKFYPKSCIVSWKR